MADQRKGIGEFFQWEQDGAMCRSEGKVDAGADFQSGMVMGKITASSLQVAWDPGASDGSETVTGILWNDVNAPLKETAVTLISSGKCKVIRQSLVWKAGLSAGNITTGEAALVSLGLTIVDAPVGIANNVAV